MNLTRLGAIFCAVCGLASAGEIQTQLPTSDWASVIKRIHERREFLKMPELSREMVLADEKGVIASQEKIKDWFGKLGCSERFAKTAALDVWFRFRTNPAHSSDKAVTADELFKYAQGLGVVEVRTNLDNLVGVKIWIWPKGENKKRVPDQKKVMRGHEEVRSDNVILKEPGEYKIVIDRIGWFGVSEAITVESKKITKVDRKLEMSPK